LLATIIIIFGSVAYYYASNLTTATTNSYVSSLSSSQQSISERLGFENVVYNPSGPSITVYVINSGSANNLQINSLILFNESAAHRIVNGYSLTQLFNMTNGASISSLNIGQEGYFIVPIGVSLRPLGSSQSELVYTIHLITKSGSAFDYEFSP
jgi:hypothetical protein